MHRLLASWFGAGLVVGRVTGRDVGSGTAASVATFPLAIWLGSAWGWQAQLAVAIGVTITGWLVVRTLPSEGDAGWIVIDEAAGTLFAVIGLTVGPALVALAVFRLADIYKHFFPGVKAAERLDGPTGIMADDLVAALYGIAGGYIFHALI